MTRQRAESIVVRGGSEGPDEAGRLRRACPLDPLLQRRPLPPTKYLSTGLRRGYLGRWELRDGRLYLLVIDDARQEPWPEALEQLFGEGAEPPFLATWFSGRLTIALGDDIGWLGSFAAERELYLWIRAGAVTRRREFTPGPWTLFGRALLYCLRAALFLIALYGSLYYAIC